MNEEEPLTYVQLEDEIERLRALNAELLVAAKAVAKLAPELFVDLETAIRKAEEQAP